MSADSFFDNISAVEELSPNDFDENESWKLKKNSCCMVLFYAPWCGYCKAVKPDFITVSQNCAFMDFYSVNCEKYKSFISTLKRDLPQLIQGYPTLVMYKRGEPYETIPDTNRDYASLMNACIRTCSNSDI